MRYVLWVVKLALFAFMLTFALKNTDPVTLRYFLGNEWRAPLIFVLLVVFCVGAALGLLGALGQILRQRREISALKRRLASPTGAAGEPAPPDVAAP
ncbi:MAG TPA: LapA family protein [Burkholderiales bacterium]|nr:LapA family protein [Burkholderiales bacterium]